jgi:cold shock CspA family protein
MSKSQTTFSKREKEKKRLSKRLEKQKKKEVRKNTTTSGLDNMMAYVDQNGVISDTPPEIIKKQDIKLSDIEISIPRKEAEEVEEYKKGVVDFFNSDKGFGFIKELGSNNKYFVHINSTLEDIKEGNLVKFKIEKGPRGMNAIEVSLDKK